MKPRVLHVITRLSVGGSSEATVATIEGLQRERYDCGLAVGLSGSDPAVVDAARRRGCRLIDVPSLAREAAVGRDLFALAALIGIIRRERPIIVHTHTSKAGFLGRLAARLAQVPAVIHQPHGHVFYGYFGRARTSVYLALERVAARWSDRIITLTDRGAEEHLARRIGRREQFVTVPSGVPTAALRAAAPTRVAAREQLGIAASDFVIAGLGRFVPIKGFDTLVAALPSVVAALPAARLLLIGDGPERPALEARATALGVAGRVHMTGNVDGVARWLMAADVLAAPSRNEGMGRALVEAMALGIPVVGSAVGGIPDVIADGESGRLVEPDAPAALAGALIALGRDPGLARKLGEAGQHRAERFSTTASEARMRAVYESVLKATPRS